MTLFSSNFTSAFFSNNERFVVTETNFKLITCGTTILHITFLACNQVDTFGLQVFTSFDADRFCLSSEGGKEQNFCLAGKDVLHYIAESW